jgi:hypothetical protein
VKLAAPTDVLDAFQMTRERRYNNSDWPEWLNAAWNQGRGLRGSLFPTSMDDPSDESLSCVSIEGYQYLIEFGDFIVRDSMGGLRPYSQENINKFFVIFVE